MPAEESMLEQFEAHRAHLRSVAYRILGSPTEAEDALQDAWLRVSRADTSAIENVGGWLTTVVARVCLNLLRSRTSRREELVDPHVPDPVVTLEDPADGPELHAVLADSVGLALQVVLETLTPSERLAFVLHDMFAVPFDEIAEIVGRSPTRPVSSPAAPGDGCRARTRPPTPTSRASVRSWTPSSPRRAPATSTRSCRSSIPTW